MLILTTFDLDEYVYEALCAGASGFLLKDVTAERLFDAVRVIAAGEALLAPSVTRRLIGEFARQPGDCRADCGHRRDSEDTREPDPRQAGAARPHPGRRDGLRERACRARRPGLSAASQTRGRVIGPLVNDSSLPVSQQVRFPTAQAPPFTACRVNLAI